jgi:hypothetical protein
MVFGKKRGELDRAAFFGFFFSFFIAFLFFIFFFPFFDLPHHGTGMGRPRGGCATGVRERSAVRWWMDEQPRETETN